MTEHIDINNSEPSDPFDAIVVGLDITPGTTVAEQSELLESIQQRQATARQEAGFMGGLIHYLPEEAIGQKYKIDLLRLMPRPEVEQMELRITYPTTNPVNGEPTTGNVFVIIGQRSNGIVSPTEDFSEEQAGLAFNQADELLDLQKRDILPNLQPDLTGIYNFSAGIMLKTD